MAKIKQGILGGFSGKVAGVVGTSWKGRAVMKSRPLSVANPRTDAQQEQRGKFSKIAELASTILTTFVQPVENPISGDISGYNKFVKDNKKAFSALGVIDDAEFVCGGGKIVNLESPSATAYEGQSSIALTWTNSASLSALRKTDKVFAAAFDEDGKLLALSSGSTTRNNQSLTIPAVEGAANFTQGEDIYIIYACVSADGRDVSVLTTCLAIEAEEV